MQQRTVAKNQLPAEGADAAPAKKSLVRIKQRLLHCWTGKEIQAALAFLLKEDQERQALLLILCSLPGVGRLPAAIVPGETAGFELIRNKRQLASYTGFDVKEKASGTSQKANPVSQKKETAIYARPCICRRLLLYGTTKGIKPSLPAWSLSREST